MEHQRLIKAALIRQMATAFNVERVTAQIRKQIVG
jgi:hypothetical protein